MGMGYGNITPWACPRDVSEEDLGRRIDEVMAKVADPGKTIMNLHVPPYASGLDYAPELDEDLRAVVTSGGPRMVPVGSTATRDAITTYAPMLGVHGHIHESRGVRDLAGVPIGIWLGRWLWTLFARHIDAVPQPTVPVLSVIIVALVTLVLANAVAALPGQSAAHTSTARVLRGE